MDPGISVPMVAILIVASGLFSGLTLGLMGLDTVHLKVLIEQPQEDEVTNLQTKCAKKILPIRARGNLLLCTLLVGNVAVNAGISILLADLTSGILGFAISTAFIVIFGEIAPQAICSRYGLIIGSKLVWLMWIIIVMLFLVTYPIAKVLDWILGQELGTILNKQQIKTLMNIYAREEKIDKGRQKLLEASLNFPEMTVQNVMRPLSDVYGLDIESRFDMELMRDIYENGYSRIPIYESKKSNIIGIMMAKDLMFLDREKIQKLWQLRDLFMRQVVYINSDDKLAGILADFKKGKTHIAVVRRTIFSDEKDHTYETVGVLTMEDIIEALIQDDIQDEHDIERKRKDKYVKKAALLFAKEEARFALTRAEQDAIKIFFVEKVPQFSPNYINPDNVQTLIEQSKVISLNGNEDSNLNITLDDEVLTLETIRKESVSYDPAEDREWDQPEKLSKYLYKKGQVSSNCYFIINGRVELNVGRDELRGDYGAFNILGNAVLKSDVYVPDYTAKVIGASRILKIKRRDYFRLKRDTDTK